MYAAKRAGKDRVVCERDVLRKLMDELGDGTGVIEGLNAVGKVVAGD